MVIFEDTSKFDRIMAFARKDNIVDTATINTVHVFMYWIFERFPAYLDMLEEMSFTHFSDKLIADWNNGNLYVSVEIQENSTTAYIKTVNEALTVIHPVTIKVVDDVCYYIGIIFNG